VEEGLVVGIGEAVTVGETAGVEVGVDVPVPGGGPEVSVGAGVLPGDWVSLGAGSPPDVLVGEGLTPGGRVGVGPVPGVGVPVAAPSGTGVPVAAAVSPACWDCPVAVLAAGMGVVLAAGVGVALAVAARPGVLVSEGSAPSGPARRLKV
jgi:hypothetical protein